MRKNPKLAAKVAKELVGKFGERLKSDFGSARRAFGTPSQRKESGGCWRSEIQRRWERSSPAG